MCIALCGAQTLRIEVPLFSSQEHDSISKHDVAASDSSKRVILSLENTFKRRTTERIWRLTGLLPSLYAPNVPDKEKILYAQNIQGLFADDTTVLVNQSGTLHQNMELSQFLKLLSTEKGIATVILDSIELPTWDYALIESNTLGVVYAESKMTAIHSIKHFSNTHTKLPIQSDETEDGTEWVPLFGRMVVTIQYRYENSKINCDNFDAIDSQLRQGTGARKPTEQGSL